MTDEPARDRFADVVGGVARTAEGGDAQRAQELDHAAEIVARSHVAICQAVAAAAAELRRRGISTDTGRFTPTGRGWRLPSIALWIAWDGSAYITGEVRTGAARQNRFDARRQPPSIFELPSWTTDGGSVRHRVVLRGERLVVSPGVRSFDDVLAAAVEQRAQLG